jgi:hypothetical protein
LVTRWTTGIILTPLPKGGIPETHKAQISPIYTLLSPAHAAAAETLADALPVHFKACPHPDKLHLLCAMV